MRHRDGTYLYGLDWSPPRFETEIPARPGHWVLRRSRPARRRWIPYLAPALVFVAALVLCSVLLAALNH